MRFIPVSPEEFKKKAVKLKAGDADFEIIGVEDSETKNKKPMMKVKCRVWDCEGREGVLIDYVTNDSQWKIKQILDSIGASAMYELGDVNEGVLVGRGGKLLLYTKNDPQYGEQTKIKSYYAMQVKKENPKSSKSDEDIPF